MNHAIVTSSESLWQLSALLYRLAATPAHSDCSEVPLRQICQLLGLEQCGAWQLRLHQAILELAASLDDELGPPSEDRDASGRPNFLPVRAGNVLHAKEALRSASYMWLNRSTESTRFAEAVENRVSESMYNFAYGLSHEINNPLANISARAQQLQRRSNDATDQQALQVIINQANRAHEMLAEMMLAVQQPQIMLAIGDVRQLAERWSDQFAQQAEHAGVHFESVISERALPARLNEVALFEACASIFQNSLQSSEPGTTITLECQRLDLPLEELDGSTDVAPQIRLAICDNGQGLTAEQLRQAFDLYYCGREAGRSLGIGLCKARRIIEAHGGTITMRSQAGVGTAVEIKLPWGNRSCK